MAEKTKNLINPLKRLDILPFRQSLPWIGGDLQTLRDSIHPVILPKDTGKRIYFDVPSLPNGYGGLGQLLALLDLPFKYPIRGFALLLHGLGGSSQRVGLRRMALTLQLNNFAVLRLNLRGAVPGRNLAAGTYAANCNSDLIPVIIKAKQLSNSLCKGGDLLPFFGVGISLGGTILLNACLKNPSILIENNKPLFDGLVCTSSPIDLASSSQSIQRNRNRFYQSWLLKRLIKQTISDPFLSRSEDLEIYKSYKIAKKLITSIREFDSLITAPRWGYENVDTYYSEASPLPALLDDFHLIPPSLFLHSLDDPWVPAEPICNLANNFESMDNAHMDFVITSEGGHNGFHSYGKCWGDHLVIKWLIERCNSIISR